MQQDSTDNIKSYHFVWTETKKCFLRLEISSATGKQLAFIVSFQLQESSQ